MFLYITIDQSTLSLESFYTSLRVLALSTCTELLGLGVYGELFRVAYAMRNSSITEKHVVFRIFDRFA